MNNRINGVLATQTAPVCVDNMKIGEAYSLSPKNLILTKSAIFIDRNCPVLPPDPDSYSLAYIVRLDRGYTDNAFYLDISKLASESMFDCELEQVYHDCMKNKDHYVIFRDPELHEYGKIRRQSIMASITALRMQLQAAIARDEPQGYILAARLQEKIEKFSHKVPLCSIVKTTEILG